MPSMYIIAGCNGAGKTTASYTILPQVFNCKEFVNADEIAKGLSPFQPETVSIQAGRIMLERIRFLIQQSTDFAFETTLSTRSYLDLIRRAKAKNFTVILFFLWLDSAELAKERVKERILRGGHSIPEEIIERRYYRGLENLQSFASLADYWIVSNNSGETAKIIAEGKNAIEILIHNSDLWNSIRKLWK
jgi:predicted ABC-type ATPase